MAAQKSRDAATGVAIILPGVATLRRIFFLRATLEKPIGALRLRQCTLRHRVQVSRGPR
jgi:hypothetical protein